MGRKGMGTIGCCLFECGPNAARYNSGIAECQLVHFVVYALRFVNREGMPCANRDMPA